MLSSIPMETSTNGSFLNYAPPSASIYYVNQSAPKNNNELDKTISILKTSVPAWSDFSNRLIKKTLTFYALLIKDNKFPSQANRIISELDGYQRLTDNWSDEGSFAPSKLALEHSKILIEKFPSGLPLPAPTLSNEGEVGFYWGSDNGYISIAIEEDGTCSIYSKNLNTGYYNFEDNLTVTDLSKGRYESLICLL